MSMEFEQTYYDVLRAIENAINTVYAQHNDLTDRSVDKALTGVERIYQAQQNSRKAPKLKLNGQEQRLFDHIQQACKWHLGQDPQLQPETTRTVDEIIACLRRIRRSVSQMEGQGRQAYVQFLANFLDAHQS
jgi:hypothetical protein